MAFGLTSGAGAIAGLWGAIVLGFIAAPLGGTPSQVSGPTGPMTVIMAAVITALIGRYGAEAGMAVAFTVALLAGALQVLFGVFRLGQYIVQMPYSVISGFMSGIGVIVVVLQLPKIMTQHIFILKLIIFQIITLMRNILLDRISYSRLQEHQ